MRVLLILLPALALAQTPPASTPASPAKTTAPAKKAPATGAVAKPAATSPAGAVAPKPAVAPGRGTPGRGAAAAKAAAPAAPAPLTTDDEKIIYAVGLSLGRSVTQFNFTPAELELVKRGIADWANSKPAVELNEWGPKIQTFMTSRATAGATKEKAAAAEYIAKVAAEPGAVKTASGLVYRETKVGTGESPKASDTVKVHYRGTLINGTEFDSSYKRNEPAQFALTGVIKCWTEGLQRMKVGGKAVLACPSELAYGDQGRPSIPGGAGLIFEVELLEIAPAK